MIGLTRDTHVSTRELKEKWRAPGTCSSRCICSCQGKIRNEQGKTQEGSLEIIHRYYKESKNANKSPTTFSHYILPDPRRKGTSTHKVQAPKSLDVDGRVETESVATNMGDSLLKPVVSKNALRMENELGQGREDCACEGCRWVWMRRRTHRLFGAHFVGCMLEWK